VILINPFNKEYRKKLHEKLGPWYKNLSRGIAVYIIVPLAAIGILKKSY
jgi:hypothetical protein